MKPLVSIIMPVYNVECYIEESIMSVQKQTFNNWELIIINDGSEDNTVSVIERFLNDERIKLLSQANQGVSAARNQGLFHAKGDFIAFLDGDDLWNDQFLEKLISIQEKCKLDLVFSGFNNLNPDGTYTPYKFKYVDGDILVPYIQNRIEMHIGSCLIDKKLLDIHNLHFTEGCVYGEDAELILKMLVFTETKVIREELMTYRKRPGSATRSLWKYENRIAEIFVYERILSYVQQYYSNPNKEQIEKTIKEKLCYDKYRFLWKMIINRNLNETLELLYNKSWSIDLEQLYQSTSLRHKLRCKIILSGNTFLWRMATFNRKIKLKAK